MTRLQVAIVGCGPHARKVAHAVMAAGGTVTRFLDERSDAAAPIPGFGFAVLRRPHRGQGESVVVAIGDEGVRRRICQELRDAGCELPVIVHPRAYVAPDAELGRGVVVFAGAIVESRARIGEGSIVDVAAIIDHDAAVPAFTHIRPGCVVSAYAKWPQESAGHPGPSAAASPAYGRDPR